MTVDHLAEAASTWQTEGWVLIDQLVPTADTEPALREAQALEPVGPEPSGPTRRPDHHAQPSKGPKFRAEQFSGTTLFPVPNSPNLNRLFVHPNIVDFAIRGLQTADIRIYQSRLWSKFGDGTNYEQPLHRDQNHSLVPTRSEPGWWFMECFLYLNDVDERNGAPNLVSRSHSQTERNQRGPIDQASGADLYQNAVAAPGRAGSLLAYRSDVWHRGMPLDEGAERHVVAVSFKPAKLEWIGFDEHAPLVNSPDFVDFVNDRSPEQLSLFGIPLPGHDYWTSETVDAMTLIYPKLDLGPWRQALRGDDR